MMAFLNLPRFVANIILQKHLVLMNTKKFQDSTKKEEKQKYATAYSQMVKQSTTNLQFSPTFLNDNRIADQPGGCSHSDKTTCSPAESPKPVNNFGCDSSRANPDQLRSSSGS